MSRSKHRVVAWAQACLLLGLAWLAGCADGEAEEAARPVLLLAAASTADAAREVATAFTARTGVAVQVSSAGSNALAAQVLAGAPADVFLSADARWADAVERDGLVRARRPLLGNRLVVVVPQGNPAGVTAIADLLGPRVRRVALAGQAVPAGRYAEQALRAAGLYERLVEDRRVARGADVRLTLSFVETGEAEAGVVYATDARASSAVDVVARFPVASRRVEYALVSLRGSSDEGRRLYAFLAGDRARDIFASHGFTPLGQ